MIYIFTMILSIYIINVAFYQIVWWDWYLAIQIYTPFFDEIKLFIIKMNGMWKGLQLHVEIE